MSSVDDETVFSHCNNGSAYSTSCVCVCLSARATLAMALLWLIAWKNPADFCGEVDHRGQLFCTTWGPDSPTKRDSFREVGVIGLRALKDRHGPRSQQLLSCYDCVTYYKVYSVIRRMQLSLNFVYTHRKDCDSPAGFYGCSSCCSSSC